MPNPTVIAASLDDKELRTSIDNLVSYVQQQTGKMTESFNNFATAAENAVKNLSKGKGNGKGGTNSKAADDQQKLTKEVENTKKSVDNLATSYENVGKAMQKVLSAEAQRQLQTIRASKQWQETGIYSQGAFANHPLYDPERLQGTKAHIREIGSLEHQYLETQKLIAKEGALQSANMREQIALGNVAVRQEQQRVIHTAENLAFHKRILAVRAEQAKRQTSKGKTEEAYLREQIASLNEISAKEVVLNNQKIASYNELRLELEQLKKAYNNLGRDRIKAGEGQDIVKRIQRTTYAMREMSTQASRPTKYFLDSLPTRTIEQLSYKIQQLRLYMSGLDWRKQSTEIKVCEAELSRLNKTYNDLLGKSSKAVTMNQTLARSWTYMKNRLAFYLTVGATTNFVKQLTDIRGQYEMTEKALGILIGSAERGTQVFQELSQMALVSPYTLIELSNAARQLNAYGIEARNLVDTTRRLADVSAAVGVPIENIAYALGHVQSYGYLTSLQARQFANAGIPLVKELAKRYSDLEGRVVSVTDVYDRMKHKQVEFADVMGVINSMTDEGGRFFDFQAKMADTLKVQLANLTLAWNNMLNDIGKSNQDLITAPIKGLKVLFQNWTSIARIITDVVTVLGVYKAYQLAVNVIQGASVATLQKKILTEKEVVASQLQRKAMTEKLTVAEKRLLASTKQVTVADYEAALAGKNLSVTQASVMVAFHKNDKALIRAILNLKILTKEQLKAALAMNKFKIAVIALGLSIKSAFASMGEFLLKNVFSVLIFAAVDLIFYWRQLSERQRELNKNIADGAKESAKAIRDFLASFKENMRLDSIEDAKKAWEEIRGQIELSSAAGAHFIGELLKIPDYSQRVTAAIDWSEKIAQAGDALSDLYDELDISEDTWLGGLFGEGLAEDLEDLGEDMANMATGAIESYTNRTNVFRSNLKEAQYEVRKFADEAKRVLELKLTADQLADPVIVREALERLRTQVKLANPKIRGEAAKFFDIEFDKDMAERLGVVADKSYSAYKMISEEIKKRYSSAFQDVANGSESLSDKQIALIRKVGADLSRNLPEDARATFDSILRDMNSRDWTIRIRTIMEGTEKTPLQKEFENRFIGNDTTIDYPTGQTRRNLNNQKYGTFLLKTGETAVEHNKRLNDEYDKQKANLSQQNKILKNVTDKESTRYKEAEAAAAKAKEQMLAIQEVGRYAGYGLITGKERSPKDRGGRHTPKPEDEVAKALKDELSLIKEMQSNYDKLRKAGVDSTTALKVASGGYEETLKRVNAILTKYGVAPFKAGDFVGKDVSNPNTLLNALIEQRRTLLSSGKVKTASIKDLDVEIQRLNVEAHAYNLKKVTDGLNNELSKIKEEYELAVELDTDPELGDMFADMFGIDVDALPRNFGEALERANKVVQQKMKDLGIDAGWFDLLSSDIRGLAAMSDVDIDADFMKKLESQQKSFRDAYKKNLSASEKDLDDYIKKHGEFSDRIAEIESSRLDRLKRLNDAYYTEEMKKSSEYQAKKRAIEKGAQEEEAKVRLEEFKESPYYEKLFENLSSLSITALQRLKAELATFKKSLARDLSPKDLEVFTKRMEEIDKVTFKKNPFKGLGKAAKEYYQSQTKEGKKERKRNAQQLAAAKEVNKRANDYLTSLKKQREQKQRQDSSDKEGLAALDEKIEKQQVIVDSTQAEVDAAQEAADKYDLMVKLFHERAAAVGQLFMVIGQNLQSISDFRDMLSINFNIHLSKELDAVIDDLAVLGKGIQQVVQSAQSGDIFGVLTGVGNVVYGVFDGIASVFGDGSARTKKLNKQIEKSQEEVRKLGLAYENLQRKVEKALGEAELYARREAIANKQAQLAELERQKSLEERKRKKDRDNDAIKQYEEQIQSLRNEIQDLRDDIVDTLFGQDVKSAAEAFVDAWVEAWRAGETTLDAINEKMDEMILNLVKKSMTNRIVGNLLQPLYDEVDRMTSSGSDGGAAITIAEAETLSKMSGTAAVAINDALGAFFKNLDQLGIVKKNIESSSALSALQQGIQGITEDTAGALEAYMNGVSQQVYYQSGVLTQIRDSVVGFDLDMQNGIISQMLLQMQQSYQVQMSIQNILQGVLNPSGRAFNVELIS